MWYVLYLLMSIAAGAFMTFTPNTGEKALAFLLFVYFHTQLLFGNHGKETKCNSK